MADSANYSKNYFTPRNIVIYLVVAALVYGAIYYFYLNRNNTAETVTTEEEVTEEVVEQPNENTMTVTLAAQNDSGETGTAILTETDGKTTVTVNVANAPEGVPQPAHIHSGACPTPGEVVYPLTNVVNGMSETVLDVDLATLRQGLPLAINVHKSASEVQVYVSCGDLQ